MKKLINQIEKNTKEFQKKISKKNRKSKSQFFTTLSIAKYMSNLSCKYNDKDNLNILDCGAGTGILAFSLVDKLIEEGFKGTLNIDLYENDEVVIDVLLKNIDIYKAKYKNLNIKVFQSNFILENMKLWEDKSFKGKLNAIISQLADYRISFCDHRKS